MLGMKIHQSMITSCVHRKDAWKIEKHYSKHQMKQRHLHCTCTTRDSLRASPRRLVAEHWYSPCCRYLTDRICRLEFTICMPLEKI